MKKFIRITSTKTLQVTGGLSVADGGAIDATDPNIRLENRLRINPTWQKDCMLIKEGSHVYPSHIAKWKSVEALEEAGILQIGAECDTQDGSDIVVAKKKTKLQEIKESEASLEEAAK